MNRLLKSLCLTTLLAISPFSLAHDYTVGELHLDHPWTRATPPGAPTAGGFLGIENHGNDADRLIGGSTAAAAEVQVHEMGMKDGVMTMRHLEAGLEIPAGETVMLEPGGYHLMLIGLKAPLTAGERVPLTLVFEHAGEVTVELTVNPIGEDGAGHGMSHD